MESCYSQQRGFLISLLLLNVLIYWGGHWKVSGCLDSEREALTNFRKALNDPSNLLSSWDDASDCCKWGGITCHNITGFVLKLDLHANYEDRLVINGRIDPALGLSGGIDRALVQLKHLQFLDLSFNAFNGAPIPDFLGSMKELRHFNLSFAGFSGRIPHQLGNLSKLISLNLSSDSLSTKNLWWLTSLPSLNYLDMSYVNLSMASHDWVHVMNKCPSLVELSLSDCRLSYISPTLPSVNFTSLRLLHLSSNNFNSTIPNWIANISSIVSLHLSYNNFHGEVPHQFSQLPNLEELGLGSTDDNLRVDWSKFLEGSWRKLEILDLSFSQLHGGIPNSIWNITSLESLTLSFSENIRGSIPRAITKLINLESLFLNGYKMHAAIPDWLHELKNLISLAFFNCTLTGPIPTTLGQLSNLYLLDLSSNSLTGNVSERVFENLKHLMFLDLSSNSLVFDPHSDWAPPFQLSDVYLRSCHLGPRFPLWLHKNMFSGNIPSQLSKLTSLQVLDVAQNCLSGSIPQSFENLMAMKNEQKINHILSYGGTGSSYYKENLFVSMKGLMLEYTRTVSLVTCMDFSSNNLFGEIPEELTSLLGLRALNLSGNQLTGNIPDKIGKLALLESLDFSENQFSSSIPLSLSNLTFLSHLNLSYNNLSGRIPRGNQLQTLEDPSIYIGNNKLCGPPLIEKCGSDETSQGPMPVNGDVEKDEEEYEIRWFYSALGPGFAVGFWAFCGILMLKKSWRIAYYRFFD